jgi:hypothetical protein
MLEKLQDSLWCENMRTLAQLFVLYHTYCLFYKTDTVSDEVHAYLTEMMNKFITTRRNIA